MEGIKPPLNLILSEEADWEKFQQEFIVYLYAEGLASESEERKIAILLELAGDDVWEIYNNSERKPNTLQELLNLIDNFVEPRQNIITNSFKFFQTRQEESEPFERFFNRLKICAKRCKFNTQEERLIRDMIVIGIADKALQERLLREGDIDLEAVAKYCRAAEAENKQKVKIKDFLYNCTRCGFNHPIRKCPAYGKKCAKCSKFNHFAAKCNKENNQRKNIYEVQEKDSSTLSFDSVSCSHVDGLTLTEEDCKTEEIYKKFRGILNELTPQKFVTLLEKVKTLEINNQKRLEGVADLIFKKAIDEPNFSETYAALCNKLSTLKVPADNAVYPNQFVNFRALIISKCQMQFEMQFQVDENVLKLEKELAECTDPAKKKELQLQLEEENQRVRMRSVGNVRFIGEFFKLKLLTVKIMVYCMNKLIEKLEEEKLECLCILLTIIGQQVEKEDKKSLDNVLKKMQEILDCKSNKISSHIRFMIQDVIELRKRRWVIKSGRPAQDNGTKFRRKLNNSSVI